MPSVFAACTDRDRDGFNASASALYDNGLVLMMDFENIADLSRYGTDVSIKGAIQSTGKYGKGLSFDGNDDFMNTSEISLNSEVVSIAFWAKIPFYSMMKKSTITEFSDNYNNYNESFAVIAGFTGTGWSNGLMLSFQDEGFNTYEYNKALVDNAGWHHWVIIFDKTAGEEIEFYVDGVKRTAIKKQSIVDGKGNFETFPLFFGGRGGKSNFAKYILDELGVWKRRLTLADINRLYTTQFKDPGCGEVDCNDANKNIYPYALEICNNIDDNCMEEADEGCVGAICLENDGGINYSYASGVWICKAEGEFSEDKCTRVHVDNCKEGSNHILQEGFCKGAVPMTAEYYCIHGCEDGRCLDCPFYLRGDVNEDGVINFDDMRALLDIIANGGIADSDAADINGDLEINQDDVDALTDLLIGDSTELMWPYPEAECV